MSKALQDSPGEEAQITVIEYPPGAIVQVHHHLTNVSVYVLEGALVMGLKGSPALNRRRGDSLYEGPQDIHTGGRDASTFL